MVEGSTVFTWLLCIHFPVTSSDTPYRYGIGTNYEERKGLYLTSALSLKCSII